MNIFKRRRAFSMIEVLVVIAVIAVVAVFVVPSLFGGSHTADLNGATEQIAASLRQAQNQSASQVQDATWGIHFSNATNTAPFYAVFSGSSYASGTVQNVYRLPPTVGFVTSTLASGATQDIVFSGISGAASVSTTIKLYVISQPSISSTITIANTGQVAFVTPTTPPTSSLPTSSIGEEFSMGGTWLAGFGNGNLAGAMGMAFDSSGNINVVSSFLRPASAKYNLSLIQTSNVQKFSSSGSYLSEFGSSGTSTGEFFGTGIAIDGSGNFWITDSLNNRVEEFSSSGSYLSQIGCSSGACSGSSANGLFNDPTGIAIDGSGNVWVVDAANERVEKFNSSGSYLSQIGCSSGACSATSTNGGFNGPLGIAIDPSGNIWVGDSGNNRIEEFNSSGAYLNQLAITGTDPQTEFTFDPSGNLWTVQNSCSVAPFVEEFNPSGTEIAEFNVAGQSASAYSYSIAISGGNIYVGLADYTGVACAR